MSTDKDGDGVAADSSESLCAQFERALADRGTENVVLRLYVAGSRPSSLRAIRNLRALCDQHLPGRFDLEVIDIYQEPETAARADIIAAPTLIKKLPLPVQRFLGDLSSTEKILVALAIDPPRDP